MKGRRVWVGLSGGVDSAVSAAVLQKTGALVTGVFIKGWYPPDMPCTWAADRRDAMRVAARLDIPFHTLDASVEYKKSVLDYLLAEYAAGRTPNPDIMCNRDVKFAAFYTFAKEHGADAIATGHYARIIHDADAKNSVKLLRGVDATKDQSYFLWAVSKDALADTVFPIGELPKSEVRILARRFNLPVAQKKDSQGICFLGSISVDDFLRKELSPAQGIVCDEEGTELGAHDGAVLYTLGERIAPHGASAGPWYVIKKDMFQNVLTVARAHNVQSSSKAIKLADTNWFQEPLSGISVTAQYRYHGPRVSGTLDASGTSFILTEPLAEPIASGQSLVLYQDDLCLGGGIIA